MVFTPTVSGVALAISILVGIAGLFAGEMKTPLRYTLLGLLIIPGAFVIFGSLFLAPTQDSNSPISFPVISTEDWQSSGIFVNEGDRIQIKHKAGMWSAAPYRMSAELKLSLPPEEQNRDWINYSAYHNGSSFYVACTSLKNFDLDDPNCPVYDGAWGNLVARFGSNTIPFAVNYGEFVFAGNSGFLEFRINDGYNHEPHLKDNMGVLAIEIFVEP